MIPTDIIMYEVILRYLYAAIVYLSKVKNEFARPYTQAQDGRALNYTLRTEVGEGPLVLLKLRNFRLPETIFDTKAASSPELNAGADPDHQEMY